MKRHLLLLFFVTLFSLGLSAQIGVRGGSQLAQNTTDVRVHIYPNPATNYISVSDHKKVDEIAIYNVVGKLIRRFKIEALIFHKVFCYDWPSLSKKFSF